MLKLTSYIGGRSCFVNPKLVTDIVERTVYDPSLDEKSANGIQIKRGQRVEGCLICFGGPEDSGVAVMEAAEIVAEAVAEECSSYADTGNVVDVAARAARRKEDADALAAKREEAGDCPDDCPGCDRCLPF